MIKIHSLDIEFSLADSTSEEPEFSYNTGTSTIRFNDIDCMTISNMIEIISFVMKMKASIKEDEND